MQWWHWVLGIGLALVSFVVAVATAGWGLAIASTILGGAIGAGYGAVTALHSRQDVKTGALLGMISGIIMGNTALAGSKIFLAKSAIGTTRVAIKLGGVLLAFAGGATAGGFNEIGNQVANYGNINNVGAIIGAVIEYGSANVLSMFTGVMIDEVEGFQAIWGIYFFDFMIGGTTLAIDVLKNL